MPVSAPTHAPPAPRGVLQRLCRKDVAHASHAGRHARRPCRPPSAAISRHARARSAATSGSAEIGRDGPAGSAERRWRGSGASSTRGQLLGGGVQPVGGAAGGRRRPAAPPPPWRLRRSGIPVLAVREAPGSPPSWPAVHGAVLSHRLRRPQLWDLRSSSRPRGSTSRSTRRRIVPRGDRPAPRPCRLTAARGDRARPASRSRPSSRTLADLACGAAPRGTSSGRCERAQAQQVLDVARAARRSAPSTGAGAAWFGGSSTPGSRRARRASWRSRC